MVDSITTRCRSTAVTGQTQIMTVPSLVWGVCAEILCMVLAMVLCDIGKHLGFGLTCTKDSNSCGFFTYKFANLSYATMFFYTEEAYSCNICKQVILDPSFSNLLSWTSRFNMLAEACRLSGVTLGFLQFLWVLRGLNLGWISWDIHS